MDVGVVIRAVDPSGDSGDAVIAEDLGGTVLLGIFDGLGHGSRAMDASQTGLACVRRNLARPLPEIMQACDAALRGTRGAAAGLALVDPRRGELAYVGVGNTSIRVVGGAEERALFSRPGIVGTGIEPSRLQAIPYNEHMTIIMHSDGIRSALDVTRYPPRILRDAQLLAETIAADYGRELDDVAVLVMRGGP